MSMKYRSAASALAIALTYLPSTANAADPPVVQLSSCEKGCDALAARLRGELEALGFDVRAPAASENAPDKRRPEAVIQLQADPLSVQLWTRASMRMRTYSVDPTDVSGDVDVLARRAAEVVRAETTVMQTPVAEPADDPPLLPPAPRRAPPRSERLPAPILAEEPDARLWIHAAPALTVSSGPIAALAQADLGLRLDPIPMLRAEIFGTVPLAPATAEKGASEVSLFTGLVGGSLGLVLGDPDALSGSLAAGLAWQWLRVDGFAAPPLSGTSETAHVTFTFVQAEIAYAVHPDVSLVAGGRVGVSAPEPVFAVAGETLGGFGRPAGTLMIGVALPITISTTSTSVSRSAAPREPGQRETSELAEETSQ
jgi:hypothetical protein